MDACSLNIAKPPLRLKLVHKHDVNIQSYYMETCGFPISNFTKQGPCPQLSYSLTAHRVKVTKQTLKYLKEELILLLCMITAL